MIEKAYKLTLVPVEGAYAVCRLAPDGPLPEWVGSGPFVSITRTRDELSVVCREEVVPEGVQCQPGWRCLRVAGTLDFALVGILAALLDPLAAAGISVFVVATYDTDYLLVKQADFPRAVEVLQRVGHAVSA